MEPMNSEQKPGIMAKLRNSKGFSLIEMAIVLVIIGIIIAAIIKGQDLLLNSRAKQLTTGINSWKINAFSYMDRNARFPGDSAKNGLISDTEGAGATAIVDIEASSMGAIPPNPLMIGGNAFWVYMGTSIAAAGGGGQPVNAMVICKTVGCAAGTILTDDELELLKTVDTAIDGEPNYGRGAFRALTVSGYLVATAATSTGGRADGYVINATASGTSSATWTTTAHIGAVWAFDKPF